MFRVQRKGMGSGLAKWEYTTPPGKPNLNGSRGSLRSDVWRLQIIINIQRLQHIRHQKKDMVPTQSIGVDPPSSRKRLPHSNKQPNLPVRRPINTRTNPSLQWNQWRIVQINIPQRALSVIAEQFVIRKLMALPSDNHPPREILQQSPSLKIGPLRSRICRSISDSNGRGDLLQN